MFGMTRYILRQLLGPMIFITLVLTGVVWLTQSLRLVELIVNRGLSAGGFFYLTLLLLPSFLAVILPIALFVSVLYVYGRLESESELVIMRSAGLSQWTLAKPAVILATAVVGIGYAVAIYFQPAGFRAFKELQFDIRGDFAAVLLQEGAFTTLAEGVTVYIRARETTGELRGILVHENRDKKRPVTMMAERGALVRTADGPRFVLFNGNRQEVDLGEVGLSLLDFERYAIDLSTYEASGGPRWREPGERFLHELFNPGTGLDDVNNAQRMRAEAHRRLTGPLYGLAYALIALGAVLAGEFNRRGRWRRIVGAVALAIGVQVLALGLPSLAAIRASLVPAMYVGVAAVLAAAAYVAFGPRRAQRPIRAGAAA